MEQIQLTLTPKQAASEVEIKKAVASKLQLPFARVESVRIIRRSVDARQRNIKVLLTVLPLLKGEVNTDFNKISYQPHYQDVHHATRQVIIVGAGPAGLFAALTLLEHGIRPIVLERGKQVSERKKDIALLNRNEGLNEESNYCFGEGGAGTFSDGKLFSRSKKRGNMQRVMELFYHHGANESVLYETHAHIGSDKLPAIIRDMRQTIIEHGGQVYFNTKVTNLLLVNTDNDQRIEGVRTQDGTEHKGEAVILAIGHSAHDTYQMLADCGVTLETKGFAMGVRVEHPQRIINQLMYHIVSSHSYGSDNHLISLLGNAPYSLSTQVNGRGVYSFCMCPGGHIVPAGSQKEGCVVNGMSASHRNSPYANSGIVVELTVEDIMTAIRDINPACAKGLEGMYFQEYLEQLCAEHGEAPNRAPAQRLRDFVESKESKTLPPCSYLPGIVPSRLDQWLPAIIGKRLQQGFRDFDKKYKGFVTNEAVILGVESRSSSAVRIPRDRDTLQHTQITNLYPCGEGAGYAGGITSSALDGINAALQIAQSL